MFVSIGYQIFKISFELVLNTVWILLIVFCGVRGGGRFSVSELVRLCECEIGSSLYLCQLLMCICLSVVLFVCGWHHVDTHMSAHFNLKYSHYICSYSDIN